jgi:hypothetical protein
MSHQEKWDISANYAVADSISLRGRPVAHPQRFGERTCNAGIGSHIPALGTR